MSLDKPPRILIYDIETAPAIIAKFDVWREGEPLWYERRGFMLSYAYKWLGERKIYFKGLPDYKGYKKDPYNDKKLVTDLHSLFTEADFIVAHNGDRFDQRVSNGRFLIHGLEPPESYKQIDTLKIARKNFRLESNRLDALGEVLGVGRKVAHTGKHLWHDCYYGDKKAWKLMKRYNLQDVKLLEDVYLKLRNWHEQHPSVAVYADIDACKMCGENKGFRKGGFKHTNTGKYRKWVCLNCGYQYNIERVNLLTKTESTRFK